MKCFKYNKMNKLNCEVKSCRYWIESQKNSNCCINIIASESYNEDKITLQDIGNLFKVTRMRICQVEKIALKKLKDRVLS